VAEKVWQVTYRHDPCPLPCLSSDGRVFFSPRVGSMSGLVAYESCDTLPAGWIGDTACPSAAGIDMASTESVSSPFC
jgi:hypothetical protein